MAGFADNTLHFYDSKADVIKKQHLLRTVEETGHASPVKWISFDAQGRYMLTASRESATLWEATIAPAYFVKKRWLSVSYSYILHRTSHIAHRTSHTVR